MQQNIEVSVICNVYNHGPYLKECLESLVNQNTSFKYEILVHDDASTDSSADIIREYQIKYPDLIKPIFQIENKYSKGIDPTLNYQEPRVKGKYIAICEGDDYWTNENKLQVQYDILESNPIYNMCAHSAIVIDGVSGSEISEISPSNEECILSVEDVIKHGGGYVATNTLFYRASLITNGESIRKICTFDYTLQILGSLRNGIYYIPMRYSAYRYMSIGSWSDNLSKNRKSGIDYYKKAIKMLWVLNKETKFDYNKTIMIAIFERLCRLIYNELVVVIFKNRGNK